MKITKQTMSFHLSEGKEFQFLPSRQDDEVLLRISDGSNHSFYAVDRDGALNLSGALIALLCDVDGNIPLDDVIKQIQASAVTAASQADNVQVMVVSTPEKKTEVS